MKISGQRKTLPLLVIALTLFFIGLSQFEVNSRAQEKSRFPVRTGYVNDFAGVVDDATRQRLEVMLQNLKLRSGIEFGIATIQSTGAKNIFDLSRELASNWNWGARNSRKKSLLLVVAVDEKTAFTQFSRSVQVDLPEGILGELTQVMRGSISAGQFSRGLDEGVNHFIGSLAKKAGFPLQDIDVAKNADARVTETTSTPSPAPVESSTVVKAASSERMATRPRVVKPRESITPTEKTPAEITPTEKTPTSNAATAKTPTSKAPTSKPVKTPYVNTPEDDADEAEEVELVLTLPLAERVPKLKEFLEAFPNSKSRPRAIELLISTYASLGDLNLKDGDAAAGLTQLSLAIDDAPVNISDQLYSGVVAQIPSNLYLRGERDAAYEAARKIEAKFGADAKRLLVLSAFYLGIEDGEEAARLATEAIKLAPDMADAHRALGLGLHIALRLDEAATEYKRALDLDPNTKKATRRSLADLNRAAGKTEAALTLYREQLGVDPNDRAARAGVVLSLLDLGRTEEGQRELDAALAKDPQDLILLAGAAYWFAAHNDSERALKLAQQAVQIEPRYTWSQIALARALSGQKRPLEAERAIRFASQYGKFPTLDYELASVLASLGLYDEAGDVLRRSFSYNRGQVSTRLAGRVPMRAESFTELLARERRASIFQVTSAERPGEAAILKSLLAFMEATDVDERGKINELRASAAAREFASGSDKMVAYRQIYAANRLLRRGVALQTALELIEAARTGVEAALEVPGVTVAVQADELRDVRARALAQGGTPDVPEAPPNVLANIMRGRVEDLAGLTLFKQDKTALAIDHFKRAVTILPEGTPSWRDALWHLGTALDQDHQQQEALNYYIRSYKAGDADPVRRVVIEELYRKINGSLVGLDERIGASFARNVGPAPAVETPLVTVPTPNAESERVASRPPTPTPIASEAVTPVNPVAAVSPTPEPVAPTPEATPVATPEPSPAATPVVEATPQATPSPESSPSPETPAPSPQPTRSTPVDPLANPLPAMPEPETRARPTTVKVTGKVKNANGEGIANVVMVLISPRGTVLSSTTDVDGNYTFIVTPSQGYRIIPSKDGFTFAPLDRLLVGLTEDQNAIDFVGTSEPAKP